MIDNLGFTLTPDSMISFQDATFPMILMSFLAFAGNTFYPCLLRLIIWIMYKVSPAKSSLKEPLSFLLDHPRRCYTLLFPSRPTWILFGILFAMNSIDVILIIVLDLNNPAVNNLAPGPRLLAAIFQAASSRHTGTATFNLADVSPAVQFSLVVMMYIAIFPIAISIRASNVYEEQTLGIYNADSDMDENNGRSYIINHIQNQLSFDLWYIFLGCFCICVAEAGKIADTSIPVSKQYRIPNGHVLTISGLFCVFSLIRSGLSLVSWCSKGDLTPISNFYLVPMLDSVLDIPPFLRLYQASSPFSASSSSA